MAIAQVNLEPLDQAWAQVAEFVPKFLAFLAILLIGWIVARLIAKAVDAILERVGFDRWVERGGVKQALARTRFDASDLLAKIVFYALMLVVLQLAFGVWGPNPVSDLLYAVIAYLPRVFVAIVIIVVAAAIANAVREIVAATLAGLSYGGVLANAAGIAILTIGVFAALNALEIAPEIVNGLFYALLAIIAGSAIVAIGGGGIQPMRRQWERALARMEEEAPRIRDEARTGPGDPAAHAPAPEGSGEYQVTTERDQTVTLPQDRRP